MPLRLAIPRAFHPPASALGRLVGRRAADARQAEALYAVAAALTAAAAALLSQWGWLAVRATAPELALVYAVAEAAGAALLGWACLWGWKPAVTVEADARGLRVRQGAAEVELPYQRLCSAARIPADAYHRHWRRYARTRAFVNRVPAELLLLRPDGPEGEAVVLGLTEPGLSELEALLTEALAAAGAGAVPAAEAA